MLTGEVQDASPGGLGPLDGLRVLEIRGIGPLPFCGMLLADLGADVVLVERPAPQAEDLDLGRHDVLNRGKRSIALDLKHAADVATLLDLVEQCDVLLEGMRPGVMERLGLSPESCLARNPRLVFGRMTGWGQDGPLAQAAAHDINYLAVSGALWYSGQPGEPPMSPPSLVGDIGGGAMYLAVGTLAAVMHARATGRGQVIDASIIDGSAHMTNLLLSLRSAGAFATKRGASLLDGPHWYRTYRCADGRFITVGAVEPRFRRVLLEKLGLADETESMKPHDPAGWATLHERWATLFASRTREAWCALLEGSDACFAPVLDPDEAPHHPHNAHRGVYACRDGIWQANPAPRFSATPGHVGRIPLRGEHRESVLRDWWTPSRHRA